MSVNIEAGPRPVPSEPLNADPEAQRVDELLGRLEAAYEETPIQAGSELSNSTESHTDQSHADVQPSLTVVDRRNAASQEYSRERSEAAAKANEQQAEAEPTTTGGITHHEYHAQRPSTGIYRDGRSFRQAGDGEKYKNGQFASEDDFDAQNGSGFKGEDGKDYRHYDEKGSAQNHYDELAGIGNQEASEGYNELGIMQLAKEEARARSMNDVADVEEIQGVLETHLKGLMDRPNGITEAQYNEEKERYKALVEKFSQRTDGESSPEAPVNDMADTNPEATTDEVEKTVESGITYEGKPVYIQDTFTNKDGAVMYELLNDEGEIIYARKEDVVNHDEEVEEENPDAETSNEKASLSEKMKAVWERTKKGVKNFFDPAYIGLLYTRANMFIDDKVINRHTEGLTGEELEKKREKNRRNLGLGLAAGLLVILGGVVAVAAAGDLAHLLHPDSTPTDLAGMGGHGDPMHGHVEAPVVPAPAAEVAPDPAYTIHSGEGGYELFRNLNLPEATWNANAQTLLDRFPQDFYRMPGGGIGIAHQGVLSQPAQDFINTLR